MQDPTSRAVVRQLLAYAEAHPSASDGVAGIQRWWLDPAGSVEVQTVNDALSWLVSRGAFSEHVAADGRSRYRRSGSEAQLHLLIAELQQAPPAGKDTAADADH